MKNLLCTVAVGSLMIVVPAWAQQPAPQKLNNHDKEFVKTGLDSNRAEAALGALAQQKAAKPEVREFGRWMATDHAFANKRLQTIAKAVGDEQQPMLTEKDKAAETQLEKAGGTTFDRQYMQAMVQSHHQAVAQFKSEAQEGQNQELKTYAENLIPALEQHLAEAQELAKGSGLSSSEATAVSAGSSAQPSASAVTPGGHQPGGKRK